MGPFQDVAADCEPQALPVEGVLPSWLHGTYVRNGPARFDFPGGASLAHWFDGMSYLQRFAFADGRISFAARFVQSDAYVAARDGRHPFDAFGTAAPYSLGTIWRRLRGRSVTDNPNVNVARYGDAYVALTEVGLPRCFDLDSLATQTPFAFNDRLGTGYTTAHPVWSEGRWINYTLAFGPTSTYTIWSMQPSGQRSPLATIRAKRPSYVHSIGVTKRYAILIEYPFTAHPLAIAFGRSPFVSHFSWRPNEPSRFHLIDLRGGEAVRTCEGEPFFSFHHAHAFDDGDDVVVDLIAYDDASIVEDLTIARLRHGPQPRTPGIGLRRYRLNLSRGAAARESIAPEPLRVELPRVNTHAPAPHVYYAPRFAQDTFQSDAIARIDTQTGELATWERPGESPAETIFVARPGSSDECDGVLLTVSYSRARDASALVVLDGRSFEEIARAWTTLALPLGFHGQFFRST